MENELEVVVISNGYTKMGFGYKKVARYNTHWITLFEDRLQMYAYHNDDVNDEKVYDTGIISIGPTNLGRLISIFLNSHN